MPKIRARNIKKIHHSFTSLIDNWSLLRKSPLDLYVWRWGHDHQALLGEHAKIQARLMDVAFCFARLKYLPKSIFLILVESVHQVQHHPKPEIKSWLRFLQTCQHLIDSSEAPPSTFLQVLLEGHPQSKEAVYQIQRDNELEIWAMAQPPNSVDRSRVCPLMIDVVGFIDIRWLNPNNILLLTKQNIEILSTVTGHALHTWNVGCSQRLHSDEPIKVQNQDLILKLIDQDTLALKLPKALQSIQIASPLLSTTDLTPISKIPNELSIPTSDKNLYASGGWIQNFNGPTFQYGQYYFRTDSDGAIRMLDSLTKESQVLMLGSLQTDVVAAYNNLLVFTVETQGGLLYVIDITEMFQLDTIEEGWCLTNGMLEKLEKPVGTIAEGLLIPNRSTVIVLTWNGIFGSTEQFELTCYTLNEELQFKVLNTAIGFGWNPLTSFSVYTDDRISVSDELGKELLWYNIESDDELFPVHFFKDIGRPHFKCFFEDYDEVNVCAYALTPNYEILDFDSGMLVISNLSSTIEFQWITDRDITFVSFLTETSIVVVLDEFPKLLTLHRPF